MTGCPHPRERSAELFQARDYVSGDLFEVARCNACGLARTMPPPSPERMAAYYPRAYYGGASSRRFPAVVEALQRVLYGARARAVERLAGRPGRVLDVGCGRGFLLDAFRRRGWSVQGTELDDRSAAHAREVLGIPVETGPADGWPWPDGHFDAVAFWHVLEHLEEPQRALDRAYGLLRAGGVLMVGVPNFASPEARVSRHRWFHLDVPRHVVHLDPGWLRRALEGAGFAARSESFLAPEYDTFSFVQSAENLLGLPHNLLYDALRGRAARLRPDAGVAPRALAFALAIPLGALAVPVTLAVALARRGSSVTIFAVRRA